MHVLIVERLLGKALPNGVEIHHVDGNGLNNAHSNLVVCPNHGYHMLLHARTEALEACGNPDWRRCWVCRKWEPLENLYARSRSHEGTEIAHRKCLNARNQAWKEKNPEWRVKYNAKRRESYKNRTIT